MKPSPTPRGEQLLRRLFNKHFKISAREITWHYIEDTPLEAVDEKLAKDIRAFFAEPARRKK